MSRRAEVAKGVSRFLTPKESHAAIREFIRKRGLTRGEMVSLLRVDLGLEISGPTLFRWLNPDWNLRRGGGVQLIARFLRNEFQSDYDGTQGGDTDGDEAAAAAPAQ